MATETQTSTMTKDSTSGTGTDNTPSAGGTSKGGDVPVVTG